MPNWTRFLLNNLLHHTLLTGDTHSIHTVPVQDLGNPSCEGGSSPDVKAALEHMLGRLAKGMQAAGIEM